MVQPKSSSLTEEVCYIVLVILLYKSTITKILRIFISTNWVQEGRLKHPLVTVDWLYNESAAKSGQRRPMARAWVFVRACCLPPDVAGRPSCTCSGGKSGTAGTDSRTPAAGNQGAI